jgi:hypothetical protein
VFEIFSKNKTTIIKTYKLLVKSDRKLLGKDKFICFLKTLKRGNNTAVVYKRAPKHFKRGKQKVFFFYAIFRQFYFLAVNSAIFFLPGGLLYEALSSFPVTLYYPTVVLSKITVKVRLEFCVLVG